MTLSNTADHFLAPGDSGQILKLGDTEYRVVSVEAIGHHGLILTYTMELVPKVVVVNLEPNVPVVVQ